jgi:hypothetical protein
MRTHVHFKAWLLFTLLALLSSGYCSAEQTPSAEQETQTETVADSSLRGENAELLRKFNNLADEIERLKARSQKAFKIDRMALLEFTAKLQNELYALLDRLFGNLQKAEQEGTDTVALRSELETIVEERSPIIRAEIAAIRDVRDELREKGITEKGASKKDLLRWLSSKIEEMLDEHEIPYEKMLWA